MPADQAAVIFFQCLSAAKHEFPQLLPAVLSLRERQPGQSQSRVSLHSHGIDIAQTVIGCDFAEQERIAGKCFDKVEALQEYSSVRQLNT